VLDRGDRRKAIFRDDADRVRFLETLAEACGRTGWRLHAYVLMGNHDHFMLETPEANLVAGMRWFQATWTIRFNRRHRLSGHLLQGRYKAVVVDPEEGAYFAVLSDYIHLNPVRAGLVGLEQRLFDYRWSSYPHYVLARHRPAWLETRAVLGELGLADTAAGRRVYAERMRREAVAARAAGERPELAELRRGWCLGRESFRERMLRLLEAAVAKTDRPSRRDAPVEKEHGEAEARRLLAAGLACCGLAEGDLGVLRKGEARKAAIAALIRRRTAVPNAWIAQALQLGHVSRVSHVVRTAQGGRWLDQLQRSV
jgi:REP element-mobilizing transposase RayT